MRRTPGTCTGKFYFNRADLQIYRQTIYDDKGAIATDVTYSACRNTTA